MELKGKVLIAQGGGPTAVINQSLVGAVLESRKFPQVTRVYGALHGVEGILNENFIDLTKETTNNLEKVAITPSSALGSTRIKRKNLTPAANYYTAGGLEYRLLPVTETSPNRCTGGCARSAPGCSSP